MRKSEVVEGFADEIESISLGKPTLEDVFVQFVGGDGARGPP